jgi:hypothetical protein
MTDENSRFDKVSERARAIVTITLLEHVMSLMEAARREAPRGVDISSYLRHCRDNACCAQALLLCMADVK